MATAQAVPAATVAKVDRPTGRRELAEGAWELAGRALHAPADLLHHAVSSVVIVDIDVGVDVNLAPRVTRAIEGAGRASARH